MSSIAKLIHNSVGTRTENLLLCAVVDAYSVSVLRSARRSSAISGQRVEGDGAPVVPLRTVPARLAGRRTGTPLSVDTDISPPAN